jgi:hypothetical protein
MGAFESIISGGCSSGRVHSVRVHLAARLPDIRRPHAIHYSLLLGPSVPQQHASDMLGARQCQLERVVIFGAIHRAVEEPGDSRLWGAWNDGRVCSRTISSQAPDDRRVHVFGHLRSEPLLNNKLSRSVRARVAADVRDMIAS